MRSLPTIEELEPRRLLSWTISGQVTQVVPTGQQFVFGSQPVPGAVLYVDLNNNGVRDPGEPNATTDAAGSYTLVGSGSGLFRIREQPPPGNPYLSNWPDGRQISISDGQTLAPVYFTNSNREVITGVVFDDLNGNGVRDPGEPGLAGWLVALGEEIGESDASGGYVISPGKLGGGYLVDLRAFEQNIRPHADGWVITTPLGGSYIVNGPPNSIHGLDFGVKQIAPPGSPAPDLVGTLSAMLPSAVRVGQTLSGTLTITNQGNAIALGSVQTTIYASAAAGTLQIGDMPLGTVSTSLNLAPGASTQASFTVTIPGGLSASTHYLTARINSSHSLLESTEENNEAGVDTPLVVAPEAADLALAIAGSAPLTATPGEAFTLPVTLSNPGGMTFSGPATIDLYASTDATLDSSDTLLSATSLDSLQLAAGASQAATLQFTAPASLSGFYFLIASVKSPAEPASADKSNNTAVSSTGVLFGASSAPASPDVALGPLDATFAPARSGPPRTITDLLLMNPTGNTVRRRVLLTLYAVPTDGGSPVAVRTLNRHVRLRPGASQRLRLRFRLSRHMAAGTYTLRAELRDMLGKSAGPVTAVVASDQTFTIAPGR